MGLFDIFKKEHSNILERSASKNSIPNFPERWSIPVSELRQHLKHMTIDDRDDEDNQVKRNLKVKEINYLVSGWEKKCNNAKKHFRSAFDKDIMKGRPYLRFVNICSENCFCSNFSNKVIKSSDSRTPFFYPPLFLGCKCSMVTHSSRELNRKGYKEDWPDIKLPDIYSTVCL